MWPHLPLLSSVLASTFPKYLQNSGLYPFTSPCPRLPCQAGCLSLRWKPPSLYLRPSLPNLAASLVPSSSIAASIQTQLLYPLSCLLCPLFPLLSHISPLSSLVEPKDRKGRASTFNHKRRPQRGSAVASLGSSIRRPPRGYERVKFVSNFFSILDSAKHTRLLTTAPLDH